MVVASGPPRFSTTPVMLGLVPSPILVPGTTAALSVPEKGSLNFLGRPAIGMI